MNQNDNNHYVSAIDQILENDSPKRFSILSLPNGQSSFNIQKTMTHHSEQTDPFRVKSEVTLGADKRRKLLVQEDHDLKTLNQKKSLSSNQSKKGNQEHGNENNEDESIVHGGVIAREEQNELEAGYHKNISPQRQDTNDHSLQLIEFKEETGHKSYNTGSIVIQSNSNNNSGNLINGNMVGMNNSISDINPQDYQMKKSYKGLAHEKSGRLSLHNKDSLLISQHGSQSLSKLSSNNQSPANRFNNQEQQNNSNHMLHNSTHTFKVERENEFRIRTSICNSANFDIRKGVSMDPLKMATQQNMNASKVNSTKNLASGGMKSFSNFIILSRVKNRLLKVANSFKFRKISLFHLKMIDDPAAEFLPNIQSKFELNANIRSTRSQLTEISKVEKSSLLINKEQQLLFQQLQQKQYEKDEELKLEQAEKKDDYGTNTDVFWPDSNGLILWDCFMLVLLIFLSVISPLYRTFDTGWDGSVSLIVCEKYISTICLSFDVCFTLNKGYFDEGLVISNRKKIIKRYARMSLWLDILNILVCSFSSQANIVFILMASLYRLIRANKLWNEIEEYLELQHKFPTLTQVLELAFLIFLIAHLCACVFFYISHYDYINGIDKTWITYQKIEKAPWKTQYIYSIYFEFITMTTIGYGDIFPCSDNERVVVIFMTLISCGVFGYSLNAIGQIVHDISMQLSSFKQTKYDISKYLKSRNITKRVQLQIFKYLEYLNRQENEGHFFMKGEIILNRVSQNLREEVQREYYGKIINQITFFTSSFSQPFLNDLSLHMKELNLAPGEYLFKEGSQDVSLFFLNKGLAEICINLPRKNERPQEKILSRIEGGTLIGHQEFLSESVRQFSVRSVNISHFIYIRKVDFRNLLEKYPLDYESFCTLKDDYIMKNQDKFQLCDSCKNTGHNLLQCNLLHPKYNNQQILKRFNYSEDQQRKVKLRYGTFKRRFNMSQIKSNLKQFRKDFINKAIKRNKKKNNESLKSEEGTIIEQSDGSDANYQTNQQQSRDSNVYTNTMRQAASFAQSEKESMTFKSYSRRANTFLDVMDDDRQFYKKYPKICYEDDNYLILSSSQRSSSGESMEEDEDEEDDQDGQISYPQFGISQNQIPSSQNQIPSIDQVMFNPNTNNSFNKQQAANINNPYMNQIDLSERFRNNIRHPSYLQQQQQQYIQQQQTHSPLNKPSSMSAIQSDTPQNISNINYETTYAGFRGTQNSTSNLSVIPYSQLSSSQYVHQNSLGQPSSPTSHPHQLNLQNQSSPISNNQSLAVNIPQILPIPQIPLSNINQLILQLNSNVPSMQQYNRGYFDSQETYEDQQQNGEAQRKIGLPTVDEISETNEQTQEMMTSFSHQLSQLSPLLKKKREKSMRHQSRKFSQNSITKSDSMASKDDLFSVRRKGSRQDTLTRSFKDVRKVTYMDPQFRDSIITNSNPQNNNTNSHNQPSLQSMTIANTLSKSHSKSSRANPFDRQRSKISQVTYLNQQHLTLYIYTFDVVKEYQQYYPHNNLSQVLKSNYRPFKKRRLIKNRKNYSNVHKSGIISLSQNLSRRQSHQLSLHTSIAPSPFLYSPNHH